MSESSLQLNNIKPAQGSARPARRVGRGNAAGQGTTAGRGYKGQKSRSGGFHKVNFEGGQMPINRRLPKIGFRSRKKILSAEIRLNDLERLTEDLVDIEVLKKAGVIPNRVCYVKLISSGHITRTVTLRGMRATAGARKAIEAAGGRVE